MNNARDTEYVMGERAAINYSRTQSVFIAKHLLEIFLANAPPNLIDLLIPPSCPVWNTQ